MLFPGWTPYRSHHLSIENSSGFHQDSTQYFSDLLSFAQSQQQQGQLETATAIYSQLVTESPNTTVPTPIRQHAQSLLATITGSAGLDPARLQFLASQFFSQVTDPVSLGSMIGAGLTYRLARFGLFRTASYLGLRGSWLQPAVTLSAFTTEATTFPLYGNLGSLALNHPVAWQQFPEAVASSFLVLGGLKFFGHLGHRASQWAQGSGGSLGSNAFQQAFMYLGIVSGHGAEQALELAPRQDVGQLFGESLGTLIHFNAAARLMPHLSGPRLRSLEQSLQLHIDRRRPERLQEAWVNTTGAQDLPKYPFRRGPEIFRMEGRGNGESFQANDALIRNKLAGFLELKATDKRRQTREMDPHHKVLRAYLRRHELTLENDPVRLKPERNIDYLLNTANSIHHLWRNRYPSLDRAASLNALLKKTDRHFSTCLFATQLLDGQYDLRTQPRSIGAPAFHFVEIPFLQRSAQREWIFKNIEQLSHAEISILPPIPPIDPVQIKLDESSNNLDPWITSRDFFTRWYILNTISEYYETKQFPQLTPSMQEPLRRPPIAWNQFTQEIIENSNPEDIPILQSLDATASIRGQSFSGVTVLGRYPTRYLPGLRSYQIANVRKHQNQIILDFTRPRQSHITGQMQIVSPTSRTFRSGEFISFIPQRYLSSTGQHDFSRWYQQGRLTWDALYRLDRAARLRFKNRLAGVFLDAPHVLVTLKEGRNQMTGRLAVGRHDTHPDARVFEVKRLLSFQNYTYLNLEAPETMGASLRVRINTIMPAQARALFKPGNTVTFIPRDS